MTKEPNDTGIGGGVDAAVADDTREPGMSGVTPGRGDEEGQPGGDGDEIVGETADADWM